MTAGLLLASFNNSNIVRASSKLPSDSIRSGTSCTTLSFSYPWYEIIDLTYGQSDTDPDLLVTFEIESVATGSKLSCNATRDHMSRGVECGGETSMAVLGEVLRVVLDDGKSVLRIEHVWYCLNDKPLYP